MEGTGEDGGEVQGVSPSHRRCIRQRCRRRELLCVGDEAATHTRFVGIFAYDLFVPDERQVCISEGRRPCAGYHPRCPAVSGIMFPGVNSGGVGVWRGGPEGARG